VSVYLVTRIAGTMEDFDASLYRLSLYPVLASAGVTPFGIIIYATAASLRVTSIISVSSSDVSATLTVLTEQTSDSLSMSLGITVEAVETISVDSLPDETGDASSSPSPPLVDGGDQQLGGKVGDDDGSTAALVVVLVVLVGLTALGLWVLYKRSQGRRPKDAVSTAVHVHNVTGSISNDLETSTARSKSTNSPARGQYPLHLPGSMPLAREDPFPDGAVAGSIARPSTPENPAETQRKDKPSGSNTDVVRSRRTGSPEREARNWAEGEVARVIAFDEEAEQIDVEVRQDELLSAHRV